MFEDLNIPGLEKSFLAKSIAGEVVGDIGQVLYGPARDRSKTSSGLQRLFLAFLSE